MTERPIYRSLVNRLAVEIPLFAKAIVDAALTKHRLDPATVTPFELKRVYEEEISPRLAHVLETSRSPHVSTLGGGLIQVGRHGTVARINASARKMLQVPAGLPSHDLIRFLESRGVVRRPEALAAQDRLLEAWTVTIEHALIRCHAAAVVDPDDPRGPPVGVTITLFDVTLERELEAAMDRASEALRVMAEEAQAANRAKSAFLATMSHEIRTPLNAVIGMTGLLLETDLSEKQREYAQISVSSARVLLGLINDVLDLSRLESGHLEVERVPFDVRLLVADAAGIVERRMRIKGLELLTHVDEAVPRRLVGDPARLRQVLLNLLDNAAKFTSEGRVVLRVLAADGVRFEVEDTGIGIPAGSLERLFRPFTQADASTTRRFGGSGLGLSICRGFVDLMGGTLEGESEEGRGTCFSFTLDLPQAPGEAEPVEREDARPARIDRPRRGRILVAEDHPVNQKVICSILEALGLEARVVSNGREAVEALVEPYDVVLMDCQMPEMDGFDATRAIRSAGSKIANPEVVVIALTANTVEEGRERCLTAGMDDYIAKPVTPASLAAVLDRWLDPASP